MRQKISYQDYEKLAETYEVISRIDAFIKPAQYIKHPCYFNRKLPEMRIERYKNWRLVHSFLELVAPVYGTPENNKDNIVKATVTTVSIDKS